MRVTSKGQVTIPQSIRERFGFQPDTEVEFEIVEGMVVLRRVGARRGNRVVAHLRGRGTVAMSTEDIMALTRPE